MRIILPFLLLACVLSIKFATCPELRSQGAGPCSDQIGCIYYEWLTQGNGCLLDCATYEKQKDECVLIYNCKWQEDKCLSKKCSDYTLYGRNTCRSLPRCKWDTDKCVESKCSELESTDITQCSRTFCKWDETKKICNDKICMDYKENGQAFCQGMQECQWANSTCVQEVIVELSSSLLNFFFFCFILIVL